MKQRVYQSFVLGFHACQTECDKLCQILEHKTRARFTHKRDMNCTIFTPHRNLGVHRYEIANAVIDGYRAAYVQ
jgi:hypothetical protein